MKSEQLQGRKNTRTIEWRAESAGNLHFLHLFALQNFDRKLAWQFPSRLVE